MKTGRGPYSLHPLNVNGWLTFVEPPYHGIPHRYVLAEHEVEWQPTLEGGEDGSSGPLELELEELSQGISEKSSWTVDPKPYPQALLG